MGNTIRREPISSRIPASPDYKFLNITDFRGIEISDNPFVTNAKTASDSLNVYVDETNTLTTRPRLELMLGKEWVSNMTKFYGLYPISLGYLLHCQISGSTNILYLIHRVGNEFTHTTIDNPDKISYGDGQLIVFEHEDGIYVISSRGYWIINYKDESDVVIHKVDAYVPVLRDGSTNTIQGSSLEERNILTNEYKETFFWDGTWSPSSIKKNPDDTLENGYEKTTITPYGFADKILRLLPAEAKEGRPWFLYREDDEIALSNGYTGGRVLGKPGEMPEKYTASKLYGDCTDDKSIIVALYGTSSTSSGSYDGGVYVYRDNAWKTLLRDTGIDLLVGAYTQRPIAINNTGTRICFGAYLSGSGAYKIVGYDWNEDTQQYEYVTFTDSLENDQTVIMARDTKRFACIKSDGNLGVFGADGESFTFEAKNIKFFDITSDGSVVFIRDANGGRFIRVADGVVLTIPSEVQSTLNHVNIGGFSSEGDKFYILSGTTGIADDVFNGYLVLGTYDNAKLVEIETYLGSYEDGCVARYDTTRIDYAIGNSITTVTYDWTINTPELVLTTTEDLERLSDLRNLFHRTISTMRFDHERWFVAGNALLGTTNNNPRYLPETMVIKLGDAEDILTGTNLVQDNLMVVYKDNKLWSISGTTDESSGERRYVTAETKNTVGNNALGAPIVSTYSEIPLQIAYDGVYGLKQLTNVYASDRISELMSEAITKKWTDEDQSVIRQAKTINRLYWTYFVLPYEDVTKIYLLDNRTTSWYYWELPIVVKNIFVKDNVVEMTDIDGNFYRLTTTDVCKEYKTEYYDAGKKVIPWYWKSQILPLGTMNYSKKLVDTTFIFTDTDSNDEYGLNYTFNAYRKAMSSTSETTISNNLNYVQSTTKKTLIPRFNFIQITISNIPENLNHNKLRLVGLGLKYVLLEGLL